MGKFPPWSLTSLTATYNHYCFQWKADLNRLWLPSIVFKQGTAKSVRPFPDKWAYLQQGRRM